MNLNTIHFKKGSFCEGLKESYFLSDPYEEAFDDVCAIYFVLLSKGYEVGPQEVLYKAVESLHSCDPVRRRGGISEVIKILRSYGIILGRSKFANTLDDHVLLWHLLESTASISSPVIMDIQGGFISVVNVHNNQDVYFMDPSDEDMLFTSMPKTDFIQRCFYLGGFVEALPILSCLPD